MFRDPTFRCLHSNSENDRATGNGPYSRHTEGDSRPTHLASSTLCYIDDNTGHTAARLTLGGVLFSSPESTESLVAICALISPRLHSTSGIGSLYGDERSLKKGSSVLVFACSPRSLRGVELEKAVLLWLDASFNLGPGDDLSLIEKLIGVPASTLRCSRAETATAPATAPGALASNGGT